MWKACRYALLLTVVATSAFAAETSYTGEAVVRSIAPTRVAVFIDTNGDRLIDNGFLLTTDVPMHSKIAVRVPKAQLLFTDGYVRVSSDDEKVYDLQVAGYPDSPAEARGKKVITLIGSALQHTQGDSGCDVDRAYEFDAGTCYAYGSE